MRACSFANRNAGGFVPGGGNLGAVALEKELEFDRDGLAGWVRQHEIDIPFRQTHLTGRQEPQQVFAKGRKEVFRGGFRLRSVLEIEQIFCNRGIRG